MRYAFVREHHQQFNLRRMCNVLTVHPGGFYAWLRRPFSKRALEVERQTEMFKPAWEGSGKGSCYDNAAVGPFFKALLAELVWRHTWATRAQVSNAFFQNINGFYNTRRKHSAIGGTSPVKFERLSA